MLNGKFYTGLPPGMIEKSTGQRNRLESHLFWPDETKVETAAEYKTKRRNSFQNETIEKTRSKAPPTTLTNVGENEVDTKRMFQKEFSNSSIQFCDNINGQHNDEVDRRRFNARTTQMGRNAKQQELAIKPTAMKLQLHDNEQVNEDYVSNKRKQAFESKIQFYDFMNDNDAGGMDANRRNNTRRPKMDMNDKKEMQRNTKNSPKLQIKRNVRDLNMRDVDSGMDMNEMHASNAKSEQMQLKRERENIHHPTKMRGTNYENAQHEFKDNEAHNSSFTQNSPKKILKSKSSPSTTRMQRDYNYENDARNDDNCTHNNMMSTNDNYQNVDERNQDYRSNRSKNQNDSRTDDVTMQHLQQNMSEMHINRSSPRKHVTYEDEIEQIYTNDADNGVAMGRAGRYFYENENNSTNFNRSSNEYTASHERLRTTTATKINGHTNNYTNNNNNTKNHNNMRSGSLQQQYQQPQQHQQRQHQYPNLQAKQNRNLRAATDYDYNETDNRTEMENASDANLMPSIGAGNTMQSSMNKSLNLNNQQHMRQRFNNEDNNNNSNNNYNNNIINNNSNESTHTHQIKITPKISTTTPKTTTTLSAMPIDDSATTPTSQTDTQKHLRSSLCFYGGEIVANNNANTNTSTTTTMNSNKKPLTKTMSTTTTTATTTPIKSSITPTNIKSNTNNTNYRRNARNAATQRVSVGLPD